MATVDISMASAITWFGLFLTLVGLALTILGLISNHQANKVMNQMKMEVNNMERAVKDLQSGALQQLLRQHDKMVNRDLGDSDRKIATSHMKESVQSLNTSSNDVDPNEEDSDSSSNF
ncbi:hypothetical protein [Alicyclobacillus fodiniaquatilis]|uniref:Uncharacterized protein n=1 Tax=Alicyclobacillus fodiniaquatilis TaxID=1661150 RepID=A0ABW4JAY8_9BACL